MNSSRKLPEKGKHGNYPRAVAGASGTRPEGVAPVLKVLARRPSTAGLEPNCGF
jgi:hypothetical protein